MKFFWISLLLTWAFAITLLIVPYGSPVIEFSYLAVPLLVIISGCAVYVGRRRWPGRMLAGCIVLGIFCDYLLVTTVSFRDEIVRAKLQGTVLSVTRSSNHNYGRVEIKNDDGSVVQMEGVAESFFQTVKANDRIEKPTGSKTAVIDAKSGNIVDDSLLDLVRK